MVASKAASSVHRAVSPACATGISFPNFHFDCKNTSRNGFLVSTAVFQVNLRRLVLISVLEENL